MEWDDARARSVLRAVFEAAMAAAEPARVLARFPPEPSQGRIATGLDPRGLLARHDSHALFDALGDLVRTGPTGTNVNDLRAALVA